MDNLIRTYILHTDVKLHPLLAFISVLGGVQAMGLWGIFIAPVVASCLHALILIVNSELKELSKDQYKAIKETFDRDDDEEEEDQEGKQAEEKAAESEEPNAEANADSKPEEKNSSQSGKKTKRVRRKSRKRSGKRR